MSWRPLAAAFALAVALHAQPSQPAQEGAVITGRVVNSKTGEPLRRVNLSLRPMGTPGGISFAAPAAAPYVAASDAEGKFRIENIEPGTYRLSAERQGFVRQEYGPPNVTGMAIGTPLHVTAGQELKDVDLKMVPHAVITGRVLDEEGEPVARVQVQAMRRRFMMGKRQLIPTGGGATNDVGEYRLSDLPPGRYFVSAVHPGQMRTMMEAPARNPGDKPEEDYALTYYPGSLDEAGARALDLQAGQQLPGIDIQLQKTAVYRVRGKVAAESPRGMRLMMMPRDAGFGSPLMFMRGGTMVKEDGTFEIGGVRPGSYYLTAMPTQGTMTTLGRTPVDVGRENVEGVVLTPSQAMTLTGKISLPKGAILPGQAAGKPPSFSNARVQLTPMEGVAFNSPSAAVKEDGSFTIENVGSDKYRVMVFNTPQGTWLKSVDAGGQDVLDTGLDLSGGTPIPIEVNLGVGPGRVAGLVQDASQQPAAGSVVMLVPDPMQTGRNDLQKTVPVDQRGQFTIEGVAPGNYKVYAWLAADPYELMDPETLKQYESRAQRVSVKENGQEQLTLAAIVPDSK